MFVTKALVIGGCLYGGINGVRERKKKKERPWAFYAERMEKNRKKKRARSRLSQNSRSLLPLTLGNSFSGNLKRYKPRLIIEKIAQKEQPELLPKAEERQMSNVEKKANRYFAISVGSLALVTTGSLLYPPLTLLSIPGLIYISVPYFQNAYRGLFKERRVGVALIDLISVSGALLMGYYFAASLVGSFYHLSRKLLIKTEDHSRKSLINIFGEQPRFVWVVRDDVEVEIRFEMLEAGDIVIAHAGEMIPVDGTITAGMARIDQRILTGESQPVEKEVGDPVLASTVVLEGKINIRVEKAGQDTVAAQIGDILNSTEDFKSLIQSRGEKIVDQGAAPTLALSALALPFFGTAGALAVLNASFGYHMRFAAPITVLNFLRITSEKGILVKDGRSLELLSQVDTFVFDKTGTLTEEVPTVGTIQTCHGYSENELLTYAAAAEYKQTHPIALAIQQEARRRALNLPAIGRAKYEVGYGLKVRVGGTLAGEGQVIRVGSGRFMEMESIALPTHIKKREEEAHAEGYSLIYVAIEEQLGGAIELRPTIRAEAKRMTSELRKRNISMIIISGDHEKPTKKLAESLAIDHYFAEVLPQDKASLVEQLQQEGKSVCFVGDGINDSIALKKANVSISLRGASTVATDAASIILMDESLNQLVSLLDIAHELDTNLNRGTGISVLLGTICIGGVFVFHFGLVSAIILYNLGLVASASNAMLPLIKHQREKSKEL